MAAASALGSTHLSTRLKAPLASCRRQCLPGLIARLLVTAATYLTRRFRGFGDGAALRGTPAAAPASSARQAAVARTGPRRGEQALASCATPSCRRWGGTRPGNKAKGWAGRPSACGVARASFRPLIRVRAQQRLVYVSPPRCERDVDGGRAHASDGELHVCERHLRVCTRRRGTIRPATERNGAVGRQCGAREAGDRDEGAERAHPPARDKMRPQSRQAGATLRVSCSQTWSCCIQQVSARVAGSSGAARRPARTHPPGSGSVSPPRAQACGRPTPQRRQPVSLRRFAHGGWVGSAPWRPGPAREMTASVQAAHLHY